jgi:16S rRNA (uracil1498-N3)-methyltransferase
MTIHRFFVDPKYITPKWVSLPEDVSKQIGGVLRLKQGETICVLDNSGWEYFVELEKLARDNVEGKVVAKKINQNELPFEITLYQSMLPRDKFEVILQKCTEIGVTKFIPVETERSLLKEKDLNKSRFERFERIIKEAAEQSERGKLPEVLMPVKLEEALKLSAETTLSYLAWERQEKTYTSKPFNNIAIHNAISLFIGPEGGFTEREVEMARQLGVQTVSLGKTILRAETAAIALATLAAFHMQ